MHVCAHLVCIDMFMYFKYTCTFMRKHVNTCVYMHIPCALCVCNNNNYSVLGRPSSPYQHTAGYMLVNLSCSQLSRFDGFIQTL